MQFPEYVREIFEHFRRAGYATYAVGGCVRDSLLGIPPHDWDLATAALPTETERIFRERNYRVRTGNGLRHGTVTVSPPDAPQVECEITTFRTEGNYTDHRRPDAVTFVTDVRADLARRDFTMNAMAAAPGDAPGGEVFLDPFGGSADLLAKRIRCVGEPEKRFREDALRILRGIRFAARYGFDVEEKTAEAMVRESNLLSAIAPERIGEELRGILSGKDCGRQMRRFASVFSELLPGCDASSYTERADAIPDVLVRTAVLLYTVPAENVKQQLIRYGYGNASAEKIARMLREKQAPIHTHADLCALADRFGGETERYFLFRRVIDGETAVLETAKKRCLALFRPGVCYNTATLAIHGNELRAIGVPDGPEIGRMLSFLTSRVIRGELPNEPQALLGAVHAEILRRMRADYSSCVSSSDSVSERDFCDG